MSFSQTQSLKIRLLNEHCLFWWFNVRSILGASFEGISVYRKSELGFGVPVYCEVKHFSLTQVEPGNSAAFLLNITATCRRPHKSHTFKRIAKEQGKTSQWGKAWYEFFLKISGLRPDAPIHRCTSECEQRVTPKKWQIIRLIKPSSQFIYPACLFVELPY